MKEKHHPRRLFKKYFSAFVQRYHCLESRGNQVRLYFCGDDLYADMLEAISQAQKFIHFEIYNLAADETGEKIAAALMERAAQGVRVRLVCDAVGCIDSKGAFYEKLAQNQIDVLPFRPLAPWRKRRGLLGRNHRKNLIIDGRTAFTGGMNICDHFSEKTSGAEAWRDTHARLSGPAAQACNHFFLETWEKVGGDSPEPSHAASVQKGIVARPKSLENDGSDLLENGDCDCIVVAGRGSSKTKSILELYCLNLKKAQKRVELSVPYFIPPQRLLKNLLDAARRGVQVDLLVPENSDMRFADWLRIGLYPVLLKNGVRIYEYQASILHAKTMVIDDTLSVVGSANFDHLSIALNWELSVLIENEQVASALKQQFQKDLQKSQLIPSDWAEKLPLHQRTLARAAAFLNRKM